jgi:hypothetical protein
VLLAAFAIGAVGAHTAAWAAVAALSTLAFATVPYRRAGLSPFWALAYPLGAAVLLVIVVQAIARGRRRVTWKGREYRDVGGDGPMPGLAAADSPPDTPAHEARAAVVGET